MTRPSHEYLRGQRIDPAPIDGRETVADLIDNAFLAYNAGRLREGCQLFVKKMLADNGTVGLALSGALTPAGLGPFATARTRKSHGGVRPWLGPKRRYRAANLTASGQHFFS